MASESTAMDRAVQIRPAAFAVERQTSDEVLECSVLVVSFHLRI